MGVVEVLASLLPQSACLLKVLGSHGLRLGDQSVAGLQVFFKAGFGHGVRSMQWMKTALWRGV